jgi:hypothetical protein
MLNSVELCLFFLLVSTTCRTSLRSAVITLWMISLKSYFCELWIRYLLYPVRNDQNLFRFHLSVEPYSLLFMSFRPTIVKWCVLLENFKWSVNCISIFSCIWSAMTENYLNALEFSFSFCGDSSRRSTSYSAFNRTSSRGPTPSVINVLGTCCMRLLFCSCSRMLQHLDVDICVSLEQSPGFLCILPVTFRACFWQRNRYCFAYAFFRYSHFFHRQ